MIEQRRKVSNALLARQSKECATLRRMLSSMRCLLCMQMQLRAAGRVSAAM